MEFSIKYSECTIHKFNEIAYFCDSASCKSALCINCLKDHSKIHKNNKTQQNLITIKDLKNKCDTKLGHQIEYILNDIKILENYYLHDYEQNLNNYLETLKNIRSKIEKIISDFFENIELKIHNEKLEIYEKNYTYVLKSLEEIKIYISNLNETKIKLNNDPSTDLIFSIFKENHEKKYQQLKKPTLEKLQLLIRESLKINDESLYTNIIENLSQTIFLEKSEKTYNEIKSPETLESISSLIKSKENLQIKSINFFNNTCQHKYLHFFQDNTKFLRIIDVESLYNSISKSCHIIEIPIDIEFDVPAWHKSIMTSLGIIILIGGLNDNKEIKDIYQFNFENLKFIKISELNYERYGHELCYLNNEIYIFGGANDKGMLDSCEKFNLGTKKCIKIACLKKKAFCACSTVFNNNCIFLFGGLFDDKILNNTIQKYDIYNDLWNIIEIIDNNNINLLWCSASVQINEEEIIIFGGYEEDNKSSNKTLIFKIENNTNNSILYNLKENNQFFLPNKEGFWNNQIIFYENNFFVLQNIQNEIDKEEELVGTSLDTRRALGFDGNEWIIYTKQS